MTTNPPGPSQAAPAVVRSPAAEAGGHVGKQKGPESSGDIEEIVVNGTAEGLVATRIETPLREIPQTVSIISAEQIRQQNFTDLGDALTNAIGITVTGDSLGRSFYSRGFEVTTFHLDGGAALNSFDLTASPFLGTPGVSEFDRVEVLRGADGLFGGNGNPGATVNLVRKRPLETSEVMFNVSAGSWNNYRVEGDVTGPLALDGALRGRLDVDASEQNYFYETAWLKRTKIFAVLEYDLSPATLLTAGGSYEWETSRPFLGGLPRYYNGMDPHLPRSTGLTFDWARYDTQTREIYLQLAHQFNDDWKLKINMTSFDDTAEYDAGYFQSVVLPISPVLPILPTGEYTVRPNTLNQFAFDATLTGTFHWLGHREDVAIGGDVLRFHGNTASVSYFYGFQTPVSNAFAYDPGTYPDPRLSTEPSLVSYADSTSDQRAIFGSLKVYLSPAWSVIAGARVSRDSAATSLLDTYGDESSSGAHGFNTPTKTTPYAGVIYDFAEHYSAYASYADIYQSNGLVREADGSFLPAIDGVNVESGIKGAWRGGALNATLAVYSIDQRGLPRDDPRQPPGGMLYGCCYLPSDSIRSRGVDLELNGRLAAGWLIGTGYTYNVNYGDSSGDLPGATPRHLLKLWTSKQLTGVLSRWTVGGSLQAQSRNYQGYVTCPMDSQGNCTGDFVFLKTTQGPYAVVGMRVSYQVDSHWQAALSVNNVFDRVYYQTVGASDSNNWYGTPRNFLLRLDARY